MALSVVEIEGITLAKKVGYIKVEVTIGVIVSTTDSHTGLFLAVFVIRDACFEANFAKGAIAVVVEEYIGSCVIGHKEISVAIVVEVFGQYTQPVVVVGPKDTRGTGDVGEGIVPIVAVESVGGSR